MYAVIICAHWIQIIVPALILLGLYVCLWERRGYITVIAPRQFMIENFGWLSDAPCASVRNRYARAGIYKADLFHFLHETYL